MSPTARVRGLSVPRLPGGVATVLSVAITLVVFLRGSSGVPLGEYGRELEELVGDFGVSTNSIHCKSWYIEAYWCDWKKKSANYSIRFPLVVHTANPFPLLHCVLVYSFSYESASSARVIF